MDFIRLVHRGHFDRQRGRFQSNSFTPLDGGISVVCVPCIAEQGTSICEHIGRYYKEIADEPPLYFQFASEQLPPEAELHWEQTDAGDVCHYSICGLNDKTARKWFKQAAPALEGFYICPGDGVSRPLHANDIADWP